jgi:hypothetical protein
MDERMRATLRLCAAALGAFAIDSRGTVVKYAELRIHPDAPGGAGVHVEYEDGTTLWLVVEGS